jgi:hypothetical protein
MSPNNPAQDAGLISFLFVKSLLLSGATFAQRKSKQDDVA